MLACIVPVTLVTDDVNPWMTLRSIGLLSTLMFTASPGAGVAAASSFSGGVGRNSVVGACPFAVSHCVGFCCSRTSRSTPLAS